LPALFRGHSVLLILTKQSFNYGDYNEQRNTHKPNENEGDAILLGCKLRGYKISIEIILLGQI